jgi:hypothetical protein
MKTIALNERFRLYVKYDWKLHPAVCKALDAAGFAYKSMPVSGNDDCAAWVDVCPESVGVARFLISKAINP